MNFALAARLYLNRTAAHGFYIMRSLSRHRRIIGLTALLGFVLTACSTIEIEATDLSVVSIGSDREAVEKLLGKPLEIFETEIVMAAGYKFDTGYKGSYDGLGDPSGCCGGDILLLPLLLAIVGTAYAIDYSIEVSEARDRQEGILANLYDSQGKLAFVARLSSDTPDINPELNRLAEQYTAAERGDRAAAFALGTAAFLPTQQHRYLAAAADKGHGEAAYDLGKAYQHGAGFMENDELAFDWFMKAAQLKHSPAYLAVAKAYLRGNGVPKNKPESERWFDEASATGNVEAQRMLSEIRREDEKAKFQALLQRAEAGQREFQIEVASGFRYGTLTDKDVQQAVHWYARAATGGDDFAPYALGSMYEEGETGTANLALAYIWYGIAERASTDSAEDLQIRRDRLSASISPVDLTWADDIVRNWPNQIGGEASIGDPLAPLIKDPPSKEAQRKAEAEKTAKTAHRLSQWQARPDILRKEIAKSHPEIYGGPWRITKFEVIGASLDEWNDKIVRLATRYSIEPRRGFGGPPEARTFRRFVVVDNSREEVVEVQAATEIN